MADQAPGTVGLGEAASGGAVLVGFEGDGVGVGELSWGQRTIWHAIEEKHDWLPIGNTRPLPAGTTVDDAVADLRFMMSRYPSMRTRLRFDPDGPKQVVSGSGEIPLEIVEAAENADPAQVAEQVWQRYGKRDYDFAADWPVRMAVVRHRGVLTHRVWVMCHLVTDGTGSRVIVQELAGRVTASSAAPPLEQARWQGSPAGQRQCRAALRHWERVLRSVPARRFPDRTGAPRPRYRLGTFDSPATYLAVRAVAARTRVEVSSVLLAVFAVALARVTGINPVVIQPTVGNRFRPGLARTVSPILQLGLCVLDLPDGTLDEAVAHTRVRAITAYKYAYYDPPRRDELVARVSRERGETVDIGCFFNDRRLEPRDETGPPPTPEQVRAALPRSTFRWTQEQDHRPFDALFITIEDVPDTVEIEVATDLHLVSPADAEACVRGMEEVAVAAALDPAARTQVPAVQGRL